MSIAINVCFSYSLSVPTYFYSQLSVSYNLASSCFTFPLALSLSIDVQNNHDC